MMKREGFIFYRSFREGARNLPENDKFLLYNAIIEYGLEGKIPILEGIVLSFFTLIKPQLDANNDRFRNGKKGGKYGGLGGRPRKPQENPIEVYDENPKKTPKEKEKEKEKEKDIYISSTSFGEFYDLYPKHEGRGDAIKAYEKALKTTTHTQIMEGVANYIREIKKEGKEKQFIKQPASRLNGQRWLDDYKVKPISLPSSAAPLPSEEMPDDFLELMNRLEKATPLPSQPVSDDRIRLLSRELKG